MEESALPLAAVALIECIAPEACVLIVRRSSHPKDPWSGHFSFPGGRLESQDPHLLATCIRETHEECGFNLQEKDLKGYLPWAMAGNYNNKPTLVAPFWFRLESQPTVLVQKQEVDSFYWLPVSRLQDRSAIEWRDCSQDGNPHPGLKLDKGFLWGFTYGVLNDWMKFR